MYIEIGDDAASASATTTAASGEEEEENRRLKSHSHDSNWVTPIYYEPNNQQKSIWTTLYDAYAPTLRNINRA